ncbi:MAG: hypothetical protein ABSF81_03060 [Bacteroidales bacterium]
MENLKELELSEMVQISGGVNVAYEIGYAIGSGLKKLFFIKTVLEAL